jgi:small-conductance mechanosensitive channel
MLTSGYLTIVFYAAVKIIDLLIMSCMRVPPLNKMRLFQFHRDVIYLKCCVIVRWSMTIGWIASTLKAFTIQDTIFSHLMAFLTTQVYWGSLSISVGPILEFGLTIWAAFLLSRFTRFILEEELYSHITLSRGLPYIFSTFVHYGILILGLFIAVEAVGIDLDKFALVGGTIGVGLGLAIQSPIGNFVAGVFLLVERPIRVGDSIQIETTGISGTIEQIGMRKSILRMENGSQVIVPNSTLTSSSIVTWSSGSPHRLVELPVTASPKADLKRILELLVKAAESDARVLKTPPPQALLTSVGSSFSYKLRVWINAEEDQVAVLRELSIELGKALADEIGVMLTRRARCYFSSGTRLRLSTNRWSFPLNRHGLRSKRGFDRSARLLIAS